MGYFFQYALGKVIGTKNERELKRLGARLGEINALEPEMEQLPDAEFPLRTEQLKQRRADGAPLEDMLPEAFALCREAGRRTLNMRHFDVQLIGGMVLHEGKIAEMKTGEGKTLVATLPIYLNALTGQGVHLVTVNDYLAKRDTQWMGAIYHLLGMSVASIQHEAAFLYDPTYPAEDPRFQNLRPISRRQAYEADITYGTNNEFGFDYLRDNMVVDLSQCVQRPLNYAIVDEVDNILIDEARTPLIISGPAQESTQLYNTFARLVPRLRPEEDYTVDEKSRSVSITEVGIAKVEKWLALPNIYDPSHYLLTHYLENALRAHALHKRDRDYVVKDGQVIIVDEYTGRLMFGRRYSEGLHQAIEAKEGVRIQRESVTLATITLQNYFRLYQKLAGMTGTAATEAEELHKIYKLEVVAIPTNKSMIRTDYSDKVHKTEEAKFRAVVKEIEELHAEQRPVLVGTVSIEKSEHLSGLLQRKGIPHQILNAKHHEQEAAIIAQAGTPGAVTIATNMAGRGVDIILGGNPQILMQEILRKNGLDILTASPEQQAEALEEAERTRENYRALVVREEYDPKTKQVAPVGGLHVLGTERHEARRIDNQLRGRSGRQGDPGSSRFYVSLEDDLMRRFGGDRIKGFMDRFGLDEDQPIENSLVSKAIESAQTRVEGHNFDIRKHLLDYDDVMNKQRELIYDERKKILSGADLKANIQDMIHEEVQGVLSLHKANESSEDENLEGLLTDLRAILPLPSSWNPSFLSQFDKEELEDKLLDYADSLYREREQELSSDNMRVLERLVMLRTIDNLWVEHLTTMEDMRHSIGLRAYGQSDPLVAYKKEAHSLFQDLLDNIRRDIARTIYHVGIAKEAMPQPTTALRAHRESGEPVKAGKKVGRNDPCPCGSGKKYKRCHGQ
ncbi:MAG: preprotein translocase subunit SecA [Chloroflexi bacterium]|nr:preprotein translocase subunit SecA [Chloroflexota bacterium]